MEEARAVLQRLERIDELERTGADPAALLDELHMLVREAEAWSRREGDERAAAAAARCRTALEGSPGVRVGL
ncbi:MAG: hypothetical protein ABR569_10125 [Gaiellaceae bacterium]